MVCVKEKEFIYIYIYKGERFWEERNKKKLKKNQIAKKVEKVIPISIGEEIKRPIGWRTKKRKLMRT